MKSKFAVLGAGMMGCAVVYDLAQSKSVQEILVADYDFGRAQEVARQFGSGKAKAVRADVRDVPALAKLVAKYEAVLNCTQYYWNLQVMQAALAARVHYLDLGGLFYTTRKQLELDNDFRNIGKLAILGIGSAPGIANVMARFLADQLDRVQFVRVYNGSRDFQSYPDALAFGFSIATILDELTIPPMHFLNGRFEARERFSGAEPMTFPKPIGKLEMRHSIHSEVASLPLSFKSKGIQEAFFKINYDPKLIEVTQLLAAIGLLEQEPVLVGDNKISPRALLEHLLKRRPPSRESPKDVETIRVVVRGKKGRRAQTLSLDATTRYTTKPALSAVARDTGFPISVAAQMISAGEITATGVRAPETAISAREFLRRLHQRGIRISGAGWR
jgi:saccharopine dehydrogenase-like NADP-dependent oxidoreductase